MPPRVGSRRASTWVGLQGHPNRARMAVADHRLLFFTTLLGYFISVSLLSLQFPHPHPRLLHLILPPPGDAEHGYCGVTQRKGVPVPAVYCSKERVKENETGYRLQRAEQILDAQVIQVTVAQLQLALRKREWLVSLDIQDV